MAAPSPFGSSSDPIDYDADPLSRLERNNRSTRNAIVFFIAIIVGSAVAALAIWAISASVGGPYCDRDATANLCSRNAVIAFSIIPTGIAMFGLFGAAAITYRMWATRRRWRPWIAVIWFIMPYSLAWLTSVGAQLITHR